MNNANYITNLLRAGTEAKRSQAIATFNEKRMADVLAAVRAKPFFLPIQFTKSAAANNEVVSDFTDSSVTHDLQVLGGITDIVTRDVNIRDMGQQELWADKHVNIEAFFGFGGNNANTTGRMGIYYYPTPFPLEAENQLEVLPKNATGGAADIKGFTTFVCERVFPENSVEGQLTLKQRDDVMVRIKGTRAPRPVALRANVSFTAASAAGTALNVQTDQYEEPLIITGAYADNIFRSTVLVNDSDGFSWSRSRIPAWAIFARKGWIHQQYNYFRPFFLPKHGRIKMDFFNGYDGANFDPVVNAGTGVNPNVTFIGWTV